MLTLQGTQQVPVIYTAHHASHDFHEFADRVALTPEQQIRFSDYGTAETVPRNGITSLVAEHSRALGDLNRDPDDTGRFQDYDYAQPQKNRIWKESNQLTTAEKQSCSDRFYVPFHTTVTQLLAKQTKPSLVIAWDNTAHYAIGSDSQGHPITMKPIILSNRGNDGSATSTSEQVSCDPALLLALAEQLALALSELGLPNQIYLNHVMRGGYICRQYSSLRNDNWLKNNGVSQRIQSLQVEYDTAITHNQATLEPNLENIAKLQQAFSSAITSTIQIVRL